MEKEQSQNNPKNISEKEDEVKASTDQTSENSQTDELAADGSSQNLSEETKEEDKSPEERILELEDKVSLKVTDKISPTFLALLSDEKRPAELVLKIAPFEGLSLSNSSNEGVNGLNCLLLTSST